MVAKVGFRTGVGEKAGVNKLLVAKGAVHSLSTALKTREDRSDLSTAFLTAGQ
jgi:hypothetical protein